MAQRYSNPPLPSNLYTAGAVRIDNRQLNQMLYEQQKIREAKREREAAALDQEYAGNAAKIRDVDVNDYTNLYGQYKQMKMGLLNNAAQLQKAGLYQQAQLATSKVYGQLMQLGNQSKELRETLSDLDKDRLKNWHNYVDDYYDIRALQNKTPLSQLHRVQTGVDAQGKPVYSDLSNANSLIYQGNDYNPNKDIEGARGKLMTNELDMGAKDKSGLQNTFNTYQFFGNKPDDYKNHLLGVMNTREGHDYYTRFAKTLTPDKIAQMQQAYNAIPDEQLKQMGLTRKELKIENPDNLADVASTYLAQQYAVNNTPRLIKTEYKTNEAVKTADQRAWEREKMGIEYSNQLKLARAKKNMDADEASDNLEKIINPLLQYSKEHPVPYLDTKGDQVNGNTLPLTKEVATTLTMPGEKYAPDAARIIFDKDGNPTQVQRIIYERNTDANGKLTNIKTKSNGKPAIDWQQSTVMPFDQFRIEMGKTIFGGQALSKILKGNTAPPKSDKTAPAAVNYDDLIKKYSSH